MKKQKQTTKIKRYPYIEVANRNKPEALSECPYPILGEVSEASCEVCPVKRPVNAIWILLKKTKL
ncbi:MAG: hypothetical protein WC906_03700 [Parcubacteria group bacterium]